MRRALAWLALLASLAGCGIEGGPGAQPPRARPVDFAGIARAVSAVRGLPQRAPVPIAVVEDATFFAALRENVRRKSAAAEAGSRPAEDVGDAFDLVPAPATRAWGDAVIDEQLVAFYDEIARRVYVRRARAFQGDGDANDRLMIAHEVEHALQHQNLPFPNLAAIAEDDARFAHKALLEGDAVVTQVALAASEGLESVPAAVVRAMARVRSGRAEELMRSSGGSDALLRAPARVREMLLFSYWGGLTFVGEIYRAGGFPLVDRVFSAPPITTEQVLHPEKYLAGEQALVVPRPPAPAGFQARATGHVGELQTAALLAQCLPVERARAAAAGWGGDTFTFAVAPGGARALLWITAWDDLAAAERFERALREVAACGGARERVGIARDATRVALVRGLAAGPAEATAAALVAIRPEAPPPRPPFGGVAPAPPLPAFVIAPASFSRGVQSSPRLGVWAAVPYGFAPGPDRDVELSVSRHAPAAALGAVEISMTVPSPAGVELMYARAVESFESASHGKRLLEAWRGTAATPLGPGVERIWSVEESFLKLRVIVVPICARGGSLMFTEAWVDPEGRAALDAWIASFRPMSADPPPVCAEINAR